MYKLDPTIPQRPCQDHELDPLGQRTFQQGRVGWMDGWMYQSTWTWMKIGWMDDGGAWCVCVCVKVRRGHDDPWHLLILNGVFTPQR